MIFTESAVAGSSRARSRRRFLLSAPALSIFGIAAPYLMAGEMPDRCTLTAADSLLLYQGLLDQVRSDAISFAGRNVAQDLQECGETLTKLSLLLKELGATVKGKNSSRLSHDLELLTNHATGDLTLTNLATRSGLGPGLVGQLISMDQLTSSSLAALSADCDLAEDSDIKELIKKMSQVIESKTEAMRRYQVSIDDWNKTVTRICRLTDEIRQKMAIAGSVIAVNSEVAAPEASSSPADKAIAPLTDAEHALSSAIRILDDVEVPVSSDKSARATLTGVLAATISILKSRPRIQATLLPVNYAIPSVHRVAGPLVPSLDAAQSSAMDSVRKVVHTSRYFDPSPGGFWQAVTCVTICLPVWLAYKWPDEKETRANLIRGSLFLVKGAVPSSYRDIANDLAAAYQS
jgi:hypothetical protein